MLIRQKRDRYEDMVHELQMTRLLPRKAQANVFAAAINAVKAAFAPKTTAPAQPAAARRSLATK